MKKTFLSDIPFKERPYLPHEHPSFLDYQKSFWKRIKNLRHARPNYRSPINEQDFVVDVDNYLPSYPTKFELKITPKSADEQGYIYARVYDLAVIERFGKLHQDINKLKELPEHSLIDQLSHQIINSNLHDKLTKLVTTDQASTNNQSLPSLTSDHQYKVTKNKKLLTLDTDTSEKMASPLYIHSLNVTNYILDAYLDQYSATENTRAYYNGWHSEQGIDSDSIEGVARLLPLIASYLVHHRQIQNLSEQEKIKQGISVDIDDTETIRYSRLLLSLKSSFKNATDPNHPGYWQELSDFEQKVCETHDFAIALWMTKDFIFNYFDSKTKHQILYWLKGISKVQTVDNNWHLFVLVTEFVIADLYKTISERENYSSNTDQGYLDNTNFYLQFLSLDRYQRIKEFYTDQGWFRDGAKGDYDFYNSWAFHYSLFWIQQIDPHFDGEFIQRVAQEFAQGFIHLFAPKGIAFFGRSLIYRFGATTGLVSANILDQKADGRVVRALLSNNNYFIAKNALKSGNMTQGLFEKDRRLVDPYSSPASVFWGLRPYVLLFYKGLETGFWCTPQEYLPVELADYIYEIPAIGLTIEGKCLSQEIVASFTYSKYAYNRKKSYLVDQPWYLKVKEFVLGRSTRPKNNLLRKGIISFSSQYTNYDH